MDAGSLGPDGDEGPSLSHRTFVGAVAAELIASLEYDSHDGRSLWVSSNLARVQSNVANEDVPVGHSAVDCRRALGAIDDKYLWQGIHLLWSGVRDEDLALAPARLMPSETREAIASGMTRGLDTAMAARRVAAQDMRQPSVKTLAWLLDLSDVREAAVECAELRGALSDSARDSIRTRYASSAADGAACVIALSGNPEGRADLMALFESVALLLDADGLPMKMASTLEATEVAAPFARTKADLERMMNAFLLLGKGPETKWCVPSRYAGDNDDDDGSGSDGDDSDSGSDSSGNSDYQEARTNSDDSMSQSDDSEIPPDLVESDDDESVPPPLEPYTPNSSPKRKADAVAAATDADVESIVEQVLLKLGPEQARLVKQAMDANDANLREQLSNEIRTLRESVEEQSRAVVVAQELLNKFSDEDSEAQLGDLRQLRDDLVASKKEVTDLIDARVIESGTALTTAIAVWEKQLKEGLAAADAFAMAEAESAAATAATAVERAREEALAASTQAKADVKDEFDGLKASIDSVQASLKEDAAATEGKIFAQMLSGSNATDTILQEIRTKLDVQDAQLLLVESTFSALRKEVRSRMSEFEEAQTDAAKEREQKLRLDLSSAMNKSDEIARKRLEAAQQLLEETQQALQQALGFGQTLASAAKEAADAALAAQASAAQLVAGRDESDALVQQQLGAAQQASDDALAALRTAVSELQQQQPDPEQQPADAREVANIKAVVERLAEQLSRLTPRFTAKELAEVKEQIALLQVSSSAVQANATTAAKEASKAVDDARGFASEVEELKDKVEIAINRIDAVNDTAGDMYERVTELKAKQEEAVKDAAGEVGLPPLTTDQLRALVSSVFSEELQQLEQTKSQLKQASKSATRAIKAAERSEKAMKTSRDLIAELKERDTDAWKQREARVQKLEKDLETMVNEREAEKELREQTYELIKSLRNEGTDDMRAYDEDFTGPDAVGDESGGDEDEDEGEPGEPGAPESTQSGLMMGLRAIASVVVAPAATGASADLCAHGGEENPDKSEGQPEFVALDDAAKLAEALLISWRRTAGRTNLPDASGTAFSASSYPPDPLLDSGWEMAPLISPLWSGKTRSEWSRTFFVRRFMANSPVELQALKVSLDGKVGRGAALRQAGMAFPDLPDNLYVRFAVSRGLCAQPGVHQVGRTAEERAFSYEFPRVPYDVSKDDRDVMRHAQALGVATRQRANALERVTDATIPIYDARLAEYQRLRVARSEGDDSGGPRDFAHDFLSGLRPATGGRLRRLVVEGQEPARQVSWAPVTRTSEDVPYSLDLSTESVAMCKAAVFEHLLVHIRHVVRTRYTPVKDGDERTARSLRALAAAIKLKQLPSLAYEANRATLGRPSTLMRAADASAMLVTRPPVHCDDPAYPEAGTQGAATIVRRMLYPADAGLCQFVTRGGTSDEQRDSGPGETLGDFVAAGEPFDTADATPSVVGCRRSVYGAAVPNEQDRYHKHTPAKVTSWLREGLGPGLTDAWVVTSTGIGPMPDANRGADGESSKRFRADLYLGKSAETTPFLRAEPRDPRAWGVGGRVPVEATTLPSLREAVHTGLQALAEQKQIECEERLLYEAKREGSEARKRLFGIGVGTETVNRDRRAGLWQEALREVAVSPDLMLRFVRMLAGGLAEEVGGLLKGEDSDVLDVQRQLRERRKEVARRSVAFQSKLIEQVLGTVFKSSSLSLDLAEHQLVGDGSKNGLLVRSSEAKKALKEASTGSGRPFFEASVELQHMIEGGTGELRMSDLMEELLKVGNQFHAKVEEDLNAGSGSAQLSRESLSLPRNAYMVRMNDTVTTAIWDSFSEVARRLRDGHWHEMRRPYLYELIEGPWPEICSLFADLVRSQLQFTRATDTAATAYISMQMKSSIAYKLEIAYRKLIKQLCVYLAAVGPPNFYVQDRRPLHRSRRLPPPPPPPEEHSPAGGSDGRPDSSLDADPEILREFWNYVRKERKIASDNARRGLRNSDPFRTAPNQAAQPQAPAPIDDAGRARFIGEYMTWFTSGRMEAAKVLRKYIFMLTHWQAAPQYVILRRQTKVSCEDYFSHLATSSARKKAFKKMVVLICKQTEGAKKAGDDARSMFEWNGWRWRSKLPPSSNTSFKRELYQVNFDDSAVDDAQLGVPPAQRDALISRALNTLYELPDQDDVELDNQGQKPKLAWKRKTVGGYVWVREVWVDDREQRKVHDKAVKQLSKYHTAMGAPELKVLLGLAVAAAMMALLLKANAYSKESGLGLSEIAGHLAETAWGLAVKPFEWMQKWFLDNTTSLRSLYNFVKNPVSRQTWMERFWASYVASGGDQLKKSVISIQQNMVEMPDGYVLSPMETANRAAAAVSPEAEKMMQMFNSTERVTPELKNMAMANLARANPDYFDYMSSGEWFKTIVASAMWAYKGDPAPDAAGGASTAGAAGAAVAMAAITATRVSGHGGATRKRKRRAAAERSLGRLPMPVGSRRPR